jgi:superfamily II DNA/RNA helicase
MADNFSNLGLKKDVLSALTALDYTIPTEVQKEIIPLILSKQNVVFTAQTGSGKTVGFSTGLFSRINLKQNIQVLIVVPTRELCLQVGTELKRFGDILGFNVGMLYGGHDLVIDRKTISRRLHILVATPGRLIQHINFKTIKLGEVSALIFDESDQMFDAGFYKDCIYIKSRVSLTAQIILSSATITSKVEQFLKKEVSKFKFIEVGVLIPPSIVQDALFCTIPEKKDLLPKFFLGEDFSRAIVFVNTKVKVNSVYDTLVNNNLSASMLSSDFDQKDREKCIRDFKTGKFSVLVCTDVASRGLDIDDVDIIVNYDVPPRSEFYVHRIGRSGRTGKKGYALTLVCPEDEEDFAIIQKEFKLNVGKVNHNFELLD